MKRPRILPAFSPEERDKAHRLLATRVAFMMGRKFEEGDWSYVYCAAKGIPERGWSNLSIDVMYRGLGIEHKMLGQPPDKPLKSVCGTRLMHPALTRAIRIPSKGDANAVMRDVLGQYARLVRARRKKVKDDAPGTQPDLRTGWLVWEKSLHEFLYFEEETLEPEPTDYTAEWRESGGGNRKTSKNLWVYERETGHKRYSITTSAGPKIQPYFDVPPPGEPNLYIFRVQGEEISPGCVRLWVTESTAREIKSIIGDLTLDNLSVIIENAAAEPSDVAAMSLQAREQATPIEVTTESYGLLTATFPSAVSDEHMFRMLLTRLRAPS